MIASLAVTALCSVLTAEVTKGVPVVPPIIGQTYEQLEQRFGPPVSFDWSGIGYIYHADFARRSGNVQSIISVSFFGEGERASSVKYWSRTIKSQ